MNKKVSICVLTYNFECYLRDCLDSILNQDYKNLEIIISDDNSSDNTVSIIQDYKTLFPNRIKVNLNISNIGITANSNKALSLCTGDYVCFIGGDDIMISNKISEQVKYLEIYKNCNLCYHDIELFDSLTGKKIKLVSEIQKPLSGNVRKLLRYGAFNGGISNMIRASSIPVEGFDYRIKIASDWLFYCSCLLPFGEIGYIDKVLVRQRKGEHNVTQISLNNLTRLKAAYEDHMLSCAILLHKYPLYARELKIRIASVLRESRNLGSNLLYRNYLSASFIFKCSIKTFICFFRKKN